MERFDFDKKIERRGTYCEKWDNQGGDYIPLWVADMDFKSPQPILDAISQRLDHGIFGYTEYGFELEDVVTDYYKKYYDITIDPKWIVYVPSVMPGVNVACRVRGGKIMYNTPMYSHIRKLSRELRCPLQEIPLKCEGGRYTFDFDLMDSAVDEDVNTFILCNPHNPVGRVFTMEELKGVSEFCERHDLLLVSDEIHSQLIFEGKHIPAFAVDDFARENSITLTSAAKTYNLPAIPVAFAIIPNGRIRREYIAQARGLFPCANVCSLAAIKAAYTMCDDWRAALLEYLKGNRDYLEERVSKIDGLSITHNEATYLSWIDARALGLDDPWEFFRKETGVNFSDGREFAGEGFIRANFGCRRAMLAEAMDKVEEAVKRL